ncbi:uncharacterized protein TrAtP1_005955 [Trichoderma atroviride]|uniref:uncharacterized protein n=1 Tax=Hypocrea atroviridis TaxID=63577 RepID=UPI003317E5A9|nr:hypothetical protein TrAtP1_005955 [Trichoderma atroviride]
MTNIGKACEACRVRKTRCDGSEPCARCINRNVSCVYRTRTRNRPRKSQAPAAATVASSASSNSDDTPGSSHSAHESQTSKPKDDNSWGFHVHSVAAITTSPSSIIQLHYGPSSNFSMLHSIYRLITGIQTPLTRREEVAQVGPGLDLFQNRQLFFGDLADSKSTTISNDYSGMFLNRELCDRVLERYLATYWHLLPILTKEDFRRRSDLLYSSPGLFSFDSPRCRGGHAGHGHWRLNPRRRNPGTVSLSAGVTGSREAGRIGQHPGNSYSIAAGTIPDGEISTAFCIFICWSGHEESSGSRST